MDRRDFFISHAGSDELWAQWIGQQLVGAGYSVELDVWDWAAGTNFVDAMVRALERAERVLAVYTDAYFERPFARAEHTAAFAGGAARRLVPVRAEACTVPELFAGLLRIELDGLGEAAARERLLAGVAGPRGRPSGPVGFPGVPAPSDVAAGGGAVFPRRRPPVWSVPARNPFFLGRDRLLTALHDRLHRLGADGAVAVVPLQGMGGVGKTQLAIEYAHRHAGDYQAVWWISVENLTVATAELVRLAATLSLPADGPTDEVLTGLWAALAERTDWLLIYDNVGDPAAVASLRPPESGQLLLTSRDPRVGRMAELIEVAEFDRAESVALLRHRCPRLNEIQADRVAAEVGDLPLAVEQAGCFLSDTGLDIADYLLLLATQPEQAGLADPTIDQHPGLAAVVSASRVRLQAVSPTGAELLDQLAFCAPEPLPLAPKPGPAGPGRFGVRVGDIATTAAVVRHITRLGLARHSGTSLQTHRLVQALLQARLSSAEQAQVRRAALHLVASATLQDPDVPASWPAYAALTPHIQALSGPLYDDRVDRDAEPEAFRRLLVDATRYLHQSGQYATGRQLVETAYRRWAVALGNDHPDTMRSANNLAACLWSLGDIAGAHALDEDTLARRRRVLGDDHPDTLRSASYLAISLWSLGELTGARTLHEDTLARYRRLLGDDHPDTLRSASYLAVCLWSLGELTGARTLHEDTLARYRRLLGDDHPDTMRSANNLAACLWSLGDIAGADALREDTLARRRQVLGEDHPDTRATAQQLADRAPPKAFDL